MKNYKYYIHLFLLFVVSVLLISCGKKDDEIISLDKYQQEDTLTNYTDEDNVSDRSIEGDSSSIEQQIDVISDVNIISNSNNKSNNSDSNSKSDTKLNNKIQKICVYICGSVVYPDVYELDEGARIVDAIKAAGGLSDDSAEEYINLARQLKDGEKIYVPSKKDMEGLEDIVTSGENVKVVKDMDTFMSAAGMESASEGSVSNGLINLNTSSIEELETIPGVGEAKAKKIISYREENGGFKKIEDIMNISGIKEGMFNKIKDYICVQ